MTEFQKLVQKIGEDWKPVHPWAEPYYLAMRTMRTIEDSFALDPGYDVVARFLSNAATWRGPVAREVKKELNVMLKEATRR